MKYCILLVTIFLNYPLAGQLSGTYTINPNGTGSTNFQSFNAAKSALVAQGISGPVVFNVAAGTYDELIVIPSIAGASQSQRIIFQGDPNNTSPAIVTASQTLTNHLGIIRLFGAKYVTLKNLTFQLSQTGTKVAIAQSYSRNIDVIDNVFLGDTGLLGLIRVGIAYDIAAASHAYGTWNIRGNVFSNLDDGAVMYGHSYSTSIDTMNFENNSMHGRRSGFKFAKINYLNISNNEVHISQPKLNANNIVQSICHLKVNNNRLTGCATALQVSLSELSPPPVDPDVVILSNSIDAKQIGIEISAPTGNTGYIRKLEINQNEIFIRGPHASIGLFVSGVNSDSANHSVISNNMINCVKAARGIQVLQSAYLDIIHNTVAIQQGISTSAAMEVSLNNGTTYFQPATITVFGNALINNSNGHCISYSGNTSYYSGDYNAFYNTNSTVVQFGNLTYSLSNWKSLGQDVYSIFGNPIFKSQRDLHVQDGLLNDTCVPIQSATIDIDGQIRDSLNTDIGADEYMPVTCFQPTELWATHIDDRSFRIHGSTAVAMTNVQLRFRVHSSNLPFHYVSGMAPSVDVSGLKPNTIYELAMRQICGAGDSSNWSESIKVKTDICPEVYQCKYLLKFTGWMSGWDGRSARVEHQGIPRDTIGLTFTNGNTAYDTIYACYNDSISIRWNYWPGFDSGLEVKDLSTGAIVFNRVIGNIQANELLGGFVANCGSNVTFRVDMDWVNTQNTPFDTVRIIGNLMPWNSTGIAMNDDDNDGIYEWTTHLADARDVRFKFTIGNLNQGVESDVQLAICGISNNTGGYDRRYITTKQNIVLPPVCFAQCHACVLGQEEFPIYRISPNPSSGTLVLDRMNSDAFCTVEVENNLGQVVFSTNWRRGETQLIMELLNLPQGQYQLRVTGGKQVKVLPFVLSTH